MPEPATIAFLGLGRMGTPMAHNLLRAGYAVRGYDLSGERLAQLVANDSEATTSPEDAARGVDLIMAERQNNLIEQSHRPTRHTERQQCGFRSLERTQGFLLPTLNSATSSFTPVPAHLRSYAAATGFVVSACGTSCRS